jgi:hypothetical protein
MRLDALRVIPCATKIMEREKESGTLEMRKLANVRGVNCDMLADICILEDRSRFLAVMQGD